MNSKKRKEDIVEHGHIHNLGISTVIFFFVLIIFFNSAPIIFSSSYSRFNSLVTSFNSFNKKLLQNSLSKINATQQERDYSSLQNVFVEAKSYVI